MNPWLTMWSQPRSTIRAIVHNRPIYGVFYLAAVFALQSFFFYANWWSLGLRADYYSLLLLGVVLSPIVGVIWLYFMGWVYHFTGRWCGGHAPALHLRAALAWSNIPTSINVVLWLILIFLNPETAFIQDGGGPSSLFINFIALILTIWSLVLLIQSLRELQTFSILRSIVNIILASLLSNVIFVLAFSLLRFLYFAL
ncbi:MAG TPA: YIP1 family protein [Chlamydiales bacterium]|nr:YIP1 family protein [Chlamydiales bacterium]